ncbi:uncharacterized protein LOC125918056 [Panthera uncia]|uniref:uncharacterized protein LOC125918054 n=1 Tax=Panthera uncia TaxID=29064 RepID=UPI0020FFA361|nr:uncharacterized protein LOC125918054 [Panthera uncia]XP_049480067.1 uncharacterized protein LOC125918056 [Panthera uncia]
MPLKWKTGSPAIWKFPVPVLKTSRSTPLSPAYISLVEDEDQHMKLSLGSSDMGLSSHLQCSKSGTTRIFTSNTHSSVVLQVIRAVSSVMFKWPQKPHRMLVTCDVMVGAEGRACAWAECLWELSVLSVLFCRGPKTALKQLSFVIAHRANRPQRRSLGWKTAYLPDVQNKKAPEFVICFVCMKKVVLSATFPKNVRSGNIDFPVCFSQYKYHSALRQIFWFLTHDLF